MTYNHKVLVCSVMCAFIVYLILHCHNCFTTNCYYSVKATTVFKVHTADTQLTITYYLVCNIMCAFILQFTSSQCTFQQTIFRVWCCFSFAVTIYLIVKYMLMLQCNFVCIYRKKQVLPSIQ